MTLTHRDLTRAAQARYAALEGKVVSGWSSEREQAWELLLAACGGTADGAPPDDVLDYTDATWARAEALADADAPPATDAERVALARWREHTTLGGSP